MKPPRIELNSQTILIKLPALVRKPEVDLYFRVNEDYLERVLCVAEPLAITWNGKHWHGSADVDCTAQDASGNTIGIIEFSTTVGDGGCAAHHLITEYLSNMAITPPDNWWRNVVPQQFLGFPMPIASKIASLRSIVNNITDHHLCIPSMELIETGVDLYAQYSIAWSYKGVKVKDAGLIRARIPKDLDKAIRDARQLHQKFRTLRAQDDAWCEKYDPPFPTLSKRAKKRAR